MDSDNEEANVVQKVVAENLKKPVNSKIRDLFAEERKDNLDSLRNKFTQNKRQKTHEHFEKKSSPLPEINPKVDNKWAKIYGESSAKIS